MVRNIINPAELGELFSDTIAIKRVSKTTKGGRVMSIAALVVVGDKNGHVGVGTGKAKENGEAIRKATDDAKKHLVSVSLDENASVTHDYIGKFSSSSILLKRAPEGTGIIAGGAVRAVVELAGIKNQSAFIRCIVLGGYILHLDLPELKNAKRLMGNLSNNVNQIARRLHEGGSIYETEVDDIVERQKQLQDTLDKILTSLDRIKR